jgi:hypothetical protein
MEMVIASTLKEIIEKTENVKFNTALTVEDRKKASEIGAIAKDLICGEIPNTWKTILEKATK